MLIASKLITCSLTACKLIIVAGYSIGHDSDTGLLRDGKMGYHMTVITSIIEQTQVQCIARKLMGGSHLKIFTRPLHNLNEKFNTTKEVPQYEE